ncbi:lipopolysaccharide-induced tumor necrosis factor-alpha factor homolog isoform X2 [Prorops nasuta]|uniref:lipopolysaccharide-induced tumor necrosis factor-alpha factor homolog isoform X2 n=1 Tax=Prorops nasuta TaxID=863751 RepID=UPI0034CE74F8
MAKPGMANESSQPSAPPLSAPLSAPPPTAPPSYEEAIANATLPNLGGVPPYPVGSSSMPLPDQVPNTTGPPIPMPMPMPAPPNYAPGHVPPTQFNAEHNFSPPPEVRIIHQQVTLSLGPNSVKMTCPSCQAEIKTSTISDHQASAHICCIILCLLGCCLCSCLPYCMSAFMSVHHFCPYCKSYIGTWKG